MVSYPYGHSETLHPLRYQRLGDSDLPSQVMVYLGIRLGGKIDRSFYSGMDAMYVLLDEDRIRSFLHG